MSARKTQYVIYGIRFEEDELNETEIDDFYNDCHHHEIKLGSVIFINSGMVENHYWLGYLVAYGGDYCDLGIVLDVKIENESIHMMNTFLKENKLQDLKETHRLYFHIITRWA